MRARQWAQEHRVHHTEDGCVHADAQRQRQNDYRREPRIADQHAQPIPDILQQLFEPHPAPDRPRVFFHARNVAEFAERRVARLLGRYAALDVVARLPLDMVANVVVETVQHAAHHAPWFHELASSPAGFRMRAMARASFSHFAVST